MKRARLAAWRWWIAAALALAGLLVGLLIALVSPHDHRAESVVRFSGPGVDALLPDLRALATSSVLAGNVTSTLRLGESADDVRGRLSASIRHGTRLVAIRARASTTDKARQLAQEAAVVLTQIVPARFASLRGEVFDPGHGIGGGDRHWFRDLGLGLLGGLVLGLFAAAWLADGDGAAPLAAAPRGDDERERLLARRTELIGRREAAVARRVGELAVRERELDRREEKLVEQRRDPSPPITPPESKPVQEPAPVVHAPAPADGALTLNELERRVAAAEAASPEQREEWQNYLFFLRDHADASGRLPSEFDALIADVFGEAVGGR